MILFFSPYGNRRIQCIIANDINQASISQSKPFTEKRKKKKREKKNQHAASMFLKTRYSSTKTTSLRNYQRDELGWLQVLNLLQCHQKGVVLLDEWITNIISISIWIFFVFNNFCISFIVISSWNDAIVLPLPVLQLIMLKEHDAEVLVRFRKSKDAFCFL